MSNQNTNSIHHAIHGHLDTFYRMVHTQNIKEQVFIETWNIMLDHVRTPVDENVNLAIGNSIGEILVLCWMSEYNSKQLSDAYSIVSKI